jgi:hypothetical protein
VSCPETYFIDESLFAADNPSGNPLHISPTTGAGPYSILPTTLDVGTWNFNINAYIGTQGAGDLISS